MEPSSDAGPTAPLQPGPSAGGPGPRRLRRRPDDGPIAGVCAGVAEYFNVDPVIVRIAAVVLLFTGPGLFAYILAWVFVPAAEGPVRYGAPQAPIDRKDRGTQIFGIVLLALALSLIWGDWWSPAREWLFPLGLIGLGAWLLLRRDADGDSLPPVPSATQGGGSASTDLTPPVEGASDTASAGAGADPTADPQDATSIQLVDGDAGSGDGPPSAPWDVPPPAAPPAPSDSARRRRMLGPIVFGTLLVWSGLAWLTDVSLETSLAVGLLIIGVGFVLGSFVGGTRALILPALLVGGALAITTAVDIPLHGPIGEQRWAPQRIEDVDDRYELSVGEGTLDLTAIELADDDRIALEASVGLGHLLVIVPRGVALDVTTEVGAGESQVLYMGQDGIGITTDQQDGDPDTTGTFVLDLQVGMGKVEVNRARVGDGRGSTTSTTVLR